MSKCINKCCFKILHNLVPIQHYNKFFKMLTLNTLKLNFTFKLNNNY